MDIIDDVLNLITGWNKLAEARQLTKHNMCELVIPFRDKYHLSDIEAISIARGEFGPVGILKWCKKHAGNTNQQVTGPLYAHGEFHGTKAWWNAWYYNHVERDEFPIFERWWDDVLKNGWLIKKEM